jgi:ABC-type multidrug transport system fused ATPase/permease subunit
MSKSPQSHAALTSFIAYMRQYKLRFFVVLTSFLIADILLALIPLFIGKLTGSLAANPVQGHDAIVFTIVLICLSTFHNLIWRLSEYLNLKLILPLSFRYENILFEKIIRQPYPYFVDKFTGKMSSYITTISQEFHDFLDNLCFNYVAQLVSFVTLSIILLSINWQTGTIFIVGIIGMALVGRHAVRNSFNKEQLAADVKSTKNGKIVDAIANFVNIKSFKKELVETRSIHKEQDKTIKSASKSYVAEVIFWATMSFFVRDFIWPLTIGLNVYLFLHNQLSIAQLATMLSAILLFTTTIWEGIWYMSQFNLKMARAEEAHRYLFGAKPLTEVNTTKEHITTLPFTKKFFIQNLHFAYPDKPDVPVLHDINLAINKGEKVGIVGKSGSGKTTLTKLLLDYYEMLPGTLQLDSENISSAEIAKLISYVPQDTSLFHRSIAENIAYATERSVTQDEIKEASKKAHAHEFISQINEGYEALVGERGVKLSAGQRQRIAIARAFLDDKPILVLDEATSALDSESEILVQKGLEALWEHKTVIAIAHRLSTLRQMDRIVVMEKGRIIEQGTHQELLELKGMYSKLWAHQSGGFLEE